MNNVCRTCTKRHIGCHSTCEKYIKEKQDNDKIREERRRKNVINDWHFDSLTKHKKKKHIRKH